MPPTRRSGHASPLEGKRSRAETGTSAAAPRVGAVDLGIWLNERHVAGWSLRELGAVVGHSTHWVRWRLTGPDADPGHPDAAAGLHGRATPGVR